MNKKFSLLDYKLFKNIKAEDMEMLLSCMDARFKLYKEGETIELLQEKNKGLLLLNGIVEATATDGNVVNYDADSLFNISKEGENNACGVKYVAKTHVSALCINLESLTRVCWFSCYFHHLLIQNSEEYK